MLLQDAVAAYYFEYASKLSPEKRFHYASRLAAWSHDPRALELLASCRPVIVPEPLNDGTLRELFSSLLDTHPGPKMNIPAISLRLPYFKQYTPLFGAEAALFRMRHLQTVYGIDARPQLLQVISAGELLALEQRLFADSEALKVLSTYAINYSYLLHRILLDDEGGVDIEALYTLGGQYDTGDAEQLRLLIYFYTHCILAETNFYARDVPAAALPTYRRMLKRLEALISEHFQMCSLDTKLEFLVCCRLCGFDTPLFKRIHEECAQSLSPEGTFVVDTHNVYTDNQAKKSFAASEHRNVLFVMGASARLGEADDPSQSADLDGSSHQAAV